MNRIARVLAVFALAMGGGVFATAALAHAEEFSNVDVEIGGVNGLVLNTCLDAAVLASGLSLPPPPVNLCAGFVQAIDDDVVLLQDVNLAIHQDGQSGSVVNNATVQIRGGDAEALASCVNYLEGTASLSQTHECSATAIADGGNVSMRNVDITIVQD